MLFRSQQNHSDFHLEFCAKEIEDGSYWFFPEINSQRQSQVTLNDIKVCIQRILDEANFEQHVLMAKLREPADDNDED